MFYIARNTILLHPMSFFFFFLTGFSHYFFRNYYFLSSPKHQSAYRTIIIYGKGIPKILGNISDFYPPPIGLLSPTRSTPHLFHPPNHQICQATNIALYILAWFRDLHHNDKITLFNSIDIWIYKLLLTFYYL